MATSIVHFSRHCRDAWTPSPLSPPNSIPPQVLEFWPGTAASVLKIVPSSEECGTDQCRRSPCDNNVSRRYSPRQEGHEIVQIAAPHWWCQLITLCQL
jgi:hypothetical protein